jgi:hypothetical protein
MNQPFVRRLGLALAALVMVLLIPTLIIAQDIPFIPHPVEGREQCLACHETGVAGAPQIPEDHAGRTNEMCQACHQVAAVTEEPTPEQTSEAVPTTKTLTPKASPTQTVPATGTSTPEASPPPTVPATETSTRRASPTATVPAAETSTPEASPSPTIPATDTPTPEASPTPTVPATDTPIPEAPPIPAGPLPVPHTLEGRENCLECHVSAETTPIPEGGPPLIPHPLIGREDCLACHEEGIGGAPQIPDDHIGRPNDVCQACHQPGQIPAAPTPTAPSEPIPTPIVYPRAEGVNTCFDCHSTLGGKQAEITDQWQRSIHGQRDVTCADCHGGDPSATTVDGAMSPEAGYIGVPPMTEIPALCASCHSDVNLMRQYDLPTDQYAKYKESVHGIRLAEGDTNVTTCFDCHGGHLVLKANDPASTVYPANVPELCASCHADKELMAPYDIPTNQYDLYRQSVHGHALLDNQDFRAPNCATCHGTHGAAPPGFEEVPNVCGSCHAATQDYYLKSPHASDGEEIGPKCITCHGRHDVGEPSEALYLGPEPTHCGACHAPDTPAGLVAQSLYDNITGAAIAQGEAETAIEAAARLGMLVSPMEAQLREANTDLITARAAQHTLDVDTVTEQTDPARVVAEEVKADAESAVAESIFRRQAMIVAVIAIGLIVVALYLLKRELDRRLETEAVEPQRTDTGDS